MRPTTCGSRSETSWCSVGRLQALAGKVDVVGPEVADAKALDIPIDAAEILVVEKAAVGKTLKEFRSARYAGEVALHHIERGGAPIPAGLETKYGSHQE